MPTRHIAPHPPCRRPPHRRSSASPLTNPDLESCWTCCSAFTRPCAWSEAASDLTRRGCRAALCRHRHCRQKAGEALESACGPLGGQHQVVPQLPLAPSGRHTHRRCSPLEGFAQPKATSPHAL